MYKYVSSNKEIASCFFRYEYTHFYSFIVEATVSAVSGGGGFTIIIYTYNYLL